MSLTAAASGFVIFLLSVQVIQGQDDWRVTYTSTKICALKGSTVEIHCSYTYPSSIMGSDTTVEETFWFTNMNGNEPVDLRKDPQYAGRVQDHCENNICTLRITDLRESDSAVYKFRFITNQAIGYTGSPGVTLSVTGLQVQVSSHVAFVEQRCQSSCPLPEDTSYVWYKNKQKIVTGITYYLAVINPADTYYCAVKGNENFPSPSVYAPRLSPVSVSPSAEIVEGSSVTLTCKGDANPAANYTWYKDDIKFHPPSEEPQLIFSSIQSSDSGEYQCTAENKLGRRTSYITIDVKYAPKLPSVSVSPSAEIVEGWSVTLTCSSDANPAATYTWYKEDQTLHHGQEGIYHFTSISSEDRGFYYCKSENRHGRIKSSGRFIEVQYAPKLPSVSVSPSAEIVEGSSVTLTCSSDANPAAIYTWYKENQKLLQGSNTYRFPSISSENSGIYLCKSENMYGMINSTTVQIDVQYKSKIIMNIIRLTLVVVMLILLLLFSLWMRFMKKKTLSSTSEPNEPKETLELKSDSDYATISALNTVDAEQTQDTEEQEDLV